MTENRTISISELQQKANAGDAQVQFELASCYANGTDAERNAEPALEWLRKAAEQGHINAQHALGLYYFLEKSRGEQASRIINKCLRDKWINKKNVDPALDLGVDLAISKRLSEANDDLAFSWLKKASEQNHVEANHWLGVCYQDGIGTQQNDQLAFDCFKKAAGQEIAESQYALALCYFEGKGVAQSDELGLHWCTKASDNDNPSAQYFLAKCYRDGKYVQPNDDLALNWVKKAAENYHDEAKGCLEFCFAQGGDAENSNEFVLKWSAKEGDAEAQYRLARMYLVSNGSKEDRTEGLYWLVQAVLSNHVEANQWLADTYLQFVFPYFSGRDDIEQCYQFAFAWLYKAYEENPEDFEVNFGLGVLYAFGKGVEKNQKLASEYFSYSQQYNPGHGDQDLLELIWDFCELFLSKANDQPWNADELAGFFISDSYISSYTSRPTTILPLLRFEFHLWKNEFKLLRDYLDNFERFASTFNVSSQNSFKSMGLSLIKQVEEKEKTHRALQEKEKEMLSFFTHTMRNALATAPESLRQAIHLLGGEVYEKDSKHYQAINKIAALFSTLSLTDCLIDTFKQSISDPQEFRQSWQKDHTGEGTPKWVIASALRQSLNRIIFMSDTSELRKLLNNPETALIKETRKSFIEEVLPLNVDSHGVDVFYDWAIIHTPAIEVSIADCDMLNFGVNQIRFSLLFAITSELILNALKYWDGKNHIQISWQLAEQGNYVLSVKNHCKANATTNLAGTHKGLAFINRLAELLGEQAQFVCKSEDQLFTAELILNKALFD